MSGKRHARGSGKFRRTIEARLFYKNVGHRSVIFDYTVTIGNFRMTNINTISR